jgi:hypothetical protein
MSKLVKVKLKENFGKRKAGTVYEVDEVKAVALEFFDYATRDLSYKVDKPVRTYTSVKKSEIREEEKDG